MILMTKFLVYFESPIEIDAEDEDDTYVVGMSEVEIEHIEESEEQ